MRAVIELHNVGKRYTSNNAVHDLSFTFDAGMRVGIFGLNGAGKTTILKLIAGLLQPTQGYIKTHMPATDDCCPLAMLSDKSTFFSWMTAKDIVNFMESLYACFCAKRFYQLLDELDVPQHQHKRVRQLSKGQLQKVKISSVLATKAKVYLFDEPLAGIDLIARDKIISAIDACLATDSDSVGIISTHEIRDVARLVNKALILSTGQVLRCLDYDHRHSDKDYLYNEFRTAVKGANDNT
ncbi:MAG: ABC transporter ATP-binding protein [Pseudomonadota bacterium]|nr:ABC transporter ATP-binding protein [Pseudomonadota bacterium]